MIILHYDVDEYIIFYLRNAEGVTIISVWEKESDSLKE